MQYEFISTGYIPTNSFMNFGGDLIVVLAQKREGSVQGLYFCGLIGGITECTEVLNRKWKFNSVSIRKFENFHVKEHYQKNGHSSNTLVPDAFSSGTNVSN